jgi:hypothetical protein
VGLGKGSAGVFHGGSWGRGDLLEWGRAELGEGYYVGGSGRQIGRFLPIDFLYLHNFRCVCFPLRLTVNLRLAKFVC